jgi:hypothetical protein
MPKILIRFKGRTVEREIEGELSIGRSSQADLAVKDNALSRVHCRFFVENDQFKVEDLKSMNGTLLNGKKISGPRDLADEDHVQIGNLNIYVEREPSEDAMDIGDLGETAPMPEPSIDTRARTVRKARGTGVFDWSEEAREIPYGLIGGVAAAVVVVVLLYSMMGGSDNQRTTVKDGDLLSGDGTFELTPGTELSAEWKTVDGSQTTARKVELSDGSGGHALELTKPGGVGGLYAGVKYQSAIEVTEKTAYRLEASARAQGLTGVAGVVVDWVDDRGRYIESAASRFTRSETWTDLSNTLISPEGAARVWIQIVIAGQQGSAFFDDLGFFEGDSASTRMVDVGDYRVRAAFGGTLVVEGVIGPVSGFLKSKNGRLGQMIDIEGGGSSAVGVNDLLHSGTLLNPATMELLGYEMDVSADGPDLIVEYRIVAGESRKLDAVGLQFPVPLQVTLNGPAGSVGLSDRERPQISSLKIRGARYEEDILFSEPMFVVEETIGTRKVVVAYSTRAATDTVVKWGFRIHRRRSAEEVPAEEVLASAEEAMSAGELGAVLSDLRDLTAREAELNTELKQRLNGIRKWVDGKFAEAVQIDLGRGSVAARLESAAMMAGAEDATVDLLETFSNHPDRDRIVETLRQRRALEEQFLLNGERPHAEKLLERARGLAGAGQDRLAEAVLTEIMLRYPGSDWARQAQELTSALGGGR